jgi:hypothetical protein
MDLHRKPLKMGVVALGYLRRIMQRHNRSLRDAHSLADAMQIQNVRRNCTKSKCEVLIPLKSLGMVAVAIAIAFE